MSTSSAPAPKRVVSGLVTVAAGTQETPRAHLVAHRPGSSTAVTAVRFTTFGVTAIG